MAQKTWATDADHPALVGWLAAQQDKELKASTDALKSAYGKLHGHLARRAEAERHLVAIDRDLVDAATKERKTLLARRAEVAAEIAAAPAQIEVLRARYKAAHLAFLQYVAQLARAEVERLGGQIKAPRAELVALRKQINVIDTGYNPGSQEKQEARANLLEEDRRQVSELKPLIDARDAARNVMKIAETRAEQSYGDTDGRLHNRFNLNNPNTWASGSGA